MFIFYPFWLAGIVTAWKRQGRYFALVLSLFWLLCGLLFTHQSAMGTAMHISAFFLPHFAVFLGVGFFVASGKLKKELVWPCGLLLVLWSAAGSAIALDRLFAAYEKVKTPYERLLRQTVVAPETLVASVYPVFVKLISGNSGIVAAAEDAETNIRLAEKFDCRMIIVDPRTGQQTDYEKYGWKLIASCPPLLAFAPISKN
jgi:hypothetical protein